MTSLFSSIYKYREGPFRNQRENYVTEILCYVLKTDLTFTKNFFKYIGLINWRIRTCITQNSDNELGRPDISIEMMDGSEILIECKIDSLQGEDQLKKYLSILKRKNNPNSKLIYLTKYQEPLDIEEISNFQHIKWQDIHNILKMSTNDVSVEFRNFLIESKMSTDYKFERTEISGIQDYTKTIAKLADITDKIKDIAIKYKFEKIKYDKTLSEGNLGVYFKLKKGYFWIGFFQYDNHKEIQFGSSVELNKRENKDKKIIDLLVKLNYKEMATDDIHYWNNIKSITYFFKNDLLDINKVLKFSEERISEIVNLKEKASH